MNKKRPIRIDGDIAYVPLTQGCTAIIDAEDAALIGQYNWYVQLAPQTVYAVRNHPEDGRQKQVRMHREIVKTPDGLKADHIDGNGLNNRKSNLRNCTQEQNSRNQRPQTGGTSAYKGVFWHKASVKWQAQIGYKYLRKHLGYFDSEQEAHAAYCRASAEIHKEFGRTE